MSDNTTTLLIISVAWPVIGYVAYRVIRSQLEASDANAKTQQIGVMVVHDDAIITETAIPEPIDEFDDGAVSSGVRSGDTIVGAWPVSGIAPITGRRGPGVTIDRYRVTRRMETESYGARYVNLSGYDEED